MLRLKNSLKKIRSIYIETRIIYGGHERNNKETALNLILVAEPQIRPVGPKGNALGISFPKDWLDLINQQESLGSEIKAHLISLSSGEKAILITNKNFDLEVEKE